MLSSNRAMEFLTFHVGAREFAVDLARVREIINPPPITRVPGMPPALLGLVGLRGDPTAVVDAGLRLDARPVVLSGRTPLIVLTVRLLDRSMEVALLVEAAGRKLELDSLLPWSEGLARFAGSDACTGFADVDGRIVLVLDVDQLMAFDRIAAASVLSLPAPAPTTVAPVATATNSRSLDSPSPPPPRGGEGRGEGAERSALPSPSEKLPVTQPRVERRRAELPAPRAAAHTATAQAAVAPAPPAPPVPRHWTPARPAAPLQPAASAGDGWTRFTAQPSAAARTVGPPSAVATHHATPPPPRRDEPPAPTPPPITPTSTRRLAWIVAGVGAALLVLLALFFGSVGGTDRRSEPSSVSPGPRAATEPVRPLPPPSFTEAAPPPRREPAAVPEPPAPAASAAPLAPATPPTPAAPPAPVAAPAPVTAPTPAAPAPAPARAARALPPAMIVTPDTPACEIHEVKKGESLWLISARLLGDPYKWPKVYGENRDRILDPNLIEIDDRIRIPGACNAARAR